MNFATNEAHLFAEGVNHDESTCALETFDRATPSPFPGTRIVPFCTCGVDEVMAGCLCNIHMIRKYNVGNYRYNETVGQRTEDMVLTAIRFLKGETEFGAVRSAQVSIDCCEKISAALRQLKSPLKTFQGFDEDFVKLGVISHAAIAVCSAVILGQSDRCITMFVNLLVTNIGKLE